MTKNNPPASDSLSLAGHAAVVRALEASGLAVYPASLSDAGAGVIVAMARDGRSARLLVAGRAGPFGSLPAQRMEISIGGRSIELAIHNLSHAVAQAVRRALPWTAPRIIGLQRSVGLGDRLGLATPGHARAVRGTGCAPYFAQQSVREMTRTQRTPEQVIDAATWGVLQAGWRDGFGSDADHLKTPADIDACVAAGFTMFTFDPGDHVQNGADQADASALPAAVAALPWAELDDTAERFRDRYVGESFVLDGGRTVTFTEVSLARAAIKYGGAIAHAAAMYRHLAARMGAKPFEIEISVDETATPTSVAEHYLIASELKRLGVRWVGLAPRFVGEFEKAIDYKGDLAAFEDAFAGHVAVARTLGPYKLSIHSGSDKFAIYPIAARLAGDLVHLKTAGTSYLEALRVVATHNPALFRNIVAFAFERFPADCASYHISADLAAVPDAAALADADLPRLLDDNHARQLLHVTFGSVLTARDPAGGFRYRDALIETLLDHEEHHHAAVAAHLRRHVQPFAR